MFCFPLPAAYHAYIFLKALQDAGSTLGSNIDVHQPSWEIVFFVITRMLRPSTQLLSSPVFSGVSVRDIRC